MTSRALGKEDVQSQLKGNTLRVYVYVLRQKKVGVRQVQRALRLSNPSLAQYHLSKLVEMGLVKEEGGEYEITKEVRVDVMRDFLRLGTLLVPRFVFYAAFFTVFAVYLLYYAARAYSTQPLALWSASLLCLACLVFWYEAMSAWRTAPAA
ncbi:MAG TPA: helix-turn-helix domain-containing protein [Conexivisphaerales archaeon]|nr:helix-turn-helix domain-containing protein [Conexivisphaerales archaeon]